jgi:hypothetical protein
MSIDSHSHWKAGGVSVAGFSHLEEDIPCQDAHAFGIRRDGWIVAAVSDGAGSAANSHIGAPAYVSAVVDFFCGCADLSSLTQEEMSVSFVREINETTTRLIDACLSDQQGKETSKSDFAATIIMAIANQDGGTFLHVGDGAGAALKLTDMEHSIVSKPQNGEYANETYFVTMDNWSSQLRITPFEDCFDTILLMSDGVTPMAMTKGCEAPFPSFVRPVVDYLVKTDAEDGQAALSNTLTREQVRAVTGDDKTLFWASTLLSHEP